MKRTIQAALVVAALLNGTYALAEDSAGIAKGNFASAFPGEAPEMIGLKSEWTYADRSTDKVAAVSAFPGEAPEMIVLESKRTYADRSTDKVAAVSAFPGEAPEMIGLKSNSTYADNFANERNLLARGASDPALSE